MIEIEREPFSTFLYEEIVPLGRKCWKESTSDKAETCAYYGEREFDIEPDLTQYQAITDKGLILIVTLRDDKALKGYIVGFLHRSLHHRHVLCGATDTIYVEPDYRSYAGVMTERFEKEFQMMGAEIIGWPTHINGPMYLVLKARGYVGDDIVMEKRLKCV